LITLFSTVSFATFSEIKKKKKRKKPKFLDHWQQIKNKIDK
jgi:hypothetical protein